MRLPLFAPQLPEWVVNADYKIATTEQEIIDALQDLDSSEEIALDTETTGLSKQFDRVVGISMSGEIATGYYFPIRHNDTELNISQELVDKYLVPYINERDFVFHSSQYDLAMLSHEGMYPGVHADVVFIARVYNPLGNNRLKALGERELGLGVVELADLISDSDIKFNMFTPEYCFRYACQDSDLTLRLRRMWKDQDRVTPYIHQLEMDIIPVIRDMELQGFPVNIEKARVHAAQADTRLAELEKSIFDYAGMSFNIGASDQLGDVLFNKLGLTPGGKTKTGKPSVDKKVLKNMTGDHKIIPLLVEWKSLGKMKSSFYAPYFERLDKQQSSTIYSNFNPWAARTGRFGSNDVALQQVSKPIKEIFIPEKGHYLADCDYSQIEYRIFASMCKDPFMIQAYMEGRDLHEATADRIREYLGLSPDDEISEENRRKAKTLNFSVLFGSGYKNVAAQLGCSEQYAKELIDEYYEQFPAIAEWKEKMHMDAINNGYCETVFGRKRRIPELDVYSPELYEYTKTGLPYGASKETRTKFYRLLHGLRVAVNTPVQGSAADIFKVALRRYGKSIKTQLPVHLHAVVHDSFVFSVREDVEPVEFQGLIKGVMEIEIPDFVPLVIDCSFGYDWKNQVSLEKFQRR